MSVVISKRLLILSSKLSLSLVTSRLDYPHLDPLPNPLSSVCCKINQFKPHSLDTYIHPTHIAYPLIQNPIRCQKTKMDKLLKLQKRETENKVYTVPKDKSCYSLGPRKYGVSACCSRKKKDRLLVHVYFLTLETISDQH